MSTRDDTARNGPDLTCPCCGYMTISDSYEICELCGWEYDSYSQNIHPDEGGGPNRMSLREAQRRFATVGAKDRRPPSAADRKDPNWKPL